MIVYALVVKKDDKEILVEGSTAESSGNFTEIARKLVKNMDMSTASSSNQHSRITVNDPSSGFTFCILMNDKLCFICLAQQKSTGASMAVPFSMLDTMSKQFMTRFGNTYTKKTSLAMTSEFGPIIRRLLEEYSNEKSNDNLTSLKADLEQVKESMQDNINKVMERGRVLEGISIQTDALMDSSTSFRESAKRLEQAERWNQIKYKVILLVVLTVILIAIIWAKSR